MEDRERSLSVTGFPHGYANIKVKLWAEKHSGPASVENVLRQDDSTMIVFRDIEGLQKFSSASIDSVEFGGSMHKLKILRPEKIEQEENTRTTRNEQETDSELLNKRSTDLFAQITQEDLYSRQFYWCDLPVLPALENKCCVLAQNINPSENSLQNVKTYFEVKKRSGGGPVKCLIQMIDGLLVVFENKSDCEACIAMSNQILSNNKILIFPKVIPEVYSDKFVLKGVGASTKEDTLIIHLESCSQQTPTVQPRGSPGVYLLEYDHSFDDQQSKQLIEKINSKQLDGNTLNAKQLTKTDCLKVVGITTDVSNDAIRVFFESKKHANGGPVTRIDRLKTQAALVYFALYTDAEKVYQKFLQSSEKAFVINGHRVTVELYHHSLSDDHTKNVIQNFQPTPMEDSGFSLSWDMMRKEELIKIVALEPNSKEYQDVATKFQSTQVIHSIVSIERIQNKPLFKRYASKRLEVTRKLQNFNQPIEHQLFYGTDADDKIISDGFDRSYAGKKNATAYGAGVYFAKDANCSRCIEYATPNSKGKRRMFLADVITGRYCVGERSMKVPPLVQNDSNTDERFDSVVDDENSPRIFVIFKDASAYPTYRITYTAT